MKSIGKTTKKKLIFSIFVFLIPVIIGFIVLNFIISNNDRTEASIKEGNEETFVYLGKENAKNEILFIFDYSCPYCHQWMKDIYPDIEKEFIETGKAKFRTQSMVYLNEVSLKLSKVDQNLKVHQPDQYYHVFFEIMDNQNFFDIPEDEIDKYISDLAKTYHLKENMLKKDPTIDVINLTSQYTKQYQLEGVPTIIVNGKVINNSFDINEIKAELTD